jgi:DNA polymerase-1
MAKTSAILVDGSGFIYRAYYASPSLTNKDGRPVGAVFGFCSMLISLLKKHHVLADASIANPFCVVLDSGRDTFRSQIYAEYKSNRQATPDELKTQMPMFSDACEAFGIPTIRKKGFEADDIIATYSTKLSEQGCDVKIISSDKDLMQLVSDNVSLFDPIKSKLIKANEVQEKYDVLPHQMIFLQALMGDASDNIPGVGGIGPKTAAKLVKEFKTPEALYQNIENVRPSRIKEYLINQMAQFNISLKLVTLEKNIPLDISFDDLKILYNFSKAADFLESHGLSSLTKRLVLD